MTYDSAHAELEYQADSVRRENERRLRDMDKYRGIVIIDESHKCTPPPIRDYAEGDVFICVCKRRWIRGRKGTSAYADAQWVNVIWQNRPWMGSLVITLISLILMVLTDIWYNPDTAPWWADVTWVLGLIGTLGAGFYWAGYTLVWFHRRYKFG